MIKHGDVPVTEVMLHTLAVPTGWYKRRDAEVMMREVRVWHKQRGWKKEGYHRLFDPKGKMAIGRSLYEVGAGCRGHNTGVIHIALCNTVAIEKMGKFDDFYTKAQCVALRDYLLELEELHGAPLKVTGHNDYAPKLCPGFKVVQDEWL